MSVRVMSLVWDSDLPPNFRLVLLAYADHANDDGASVYPGEDRMCDKTGYSVQTIRRITADLIDAEMLIRVKPGHRGQRAEYHVVLSTLKASHLEMQSDKASHIDTESLSPGAGKPLTGDTPNHHEPSEPPTVLFDAKTITDQNLNPGIRRTG